jgi:hypothetical protein
MRRKKSASRTVKIVPLSIAVAALSGGTAFAAETEFDHIQVELPSGGFYEFDLGLASENEAYAAKVKEALDKAFAAEGKSILVQVGENEWVEFGRNASSELTLADIEKDKEKYAGIPAPDPYTSV